MVELEGPHGAGVLSLVQSLGDLAGFRSSASVLCEDVEVLERKLQRSLTSSRNYDNALATLQAAQAELFTALADYSLEADKGCGSEGYEANSQLRELSMRMGELATHNDLLVQQLRLLLTEGLDHHWIQGHISACRNARRTMEHAASNYDGILARYLGHKSTEKGGLTSKLRHKDASVKSVKQDKAAAELEQAEVYYHDTQIEVARQLNECKARQRWHILEMAVTSIEAHQRWAERNARTLQAMAPTMAESRKHVQALQEEDRVQHEAVERLLAQHEGVRRERRAAATRVKQQGPEAVPSCNVDQVMSAISQQMHSFQAPGRIILRQGFLLRRVLGVAGRPSWDRRFFTLTSDGMLNYYSEAVLARNPAAFLCSTDGSQVHQEGVVLPHKQLSILGATVTQGALDNPALRHCFRLAVAADAVAGAAKTNVKGKDVLTLELQASSDLEQYEWMASIQALAKCVSSGLVQLSEPMSEDQMAKMANSRTSSFATSTADSWAPSTGLGRPGGRAPGGWLAGHDNSDARSVTASETSDEGQALSSRVSSRRSSFAGSAASSVSGISSRLGFRRHPAAGAGASATPLGNRPASPGPHLDSAVGSVDPAAKVDHYLHSASGSHLLHAALPPAGPPRVGVPFPVAPIDASNLAMASQISQLAQQFSADELAQMAPWSVQASAAGSPSSLRPLAPAATRDLDRPSPGRGVGFTPSPIYDDMDQPPEPGSPAESTASDLSSRLGLNRPRRTAGLPPHAPPQPSAQPPGTGSAANSSLGRANQGQYASEYRFGTDHAQLAGGSESGNSAMHSPAEVSLRPPADALHESSLPAQMLPPVQRPASQVVGHATGDEESPRATAYQKSALGGGHLPPPPRPRRVTWDAGGSPPASPPAARTTAAARPGPQARMDTDQPALPDQFSVGELAFLAATTDRAGGAPQRRQWQPSAGLATLPEAQPVAVRQPSAASASSGDSGDGRPSQPALGQPGAADSQSSGSELGGRAVPPRPSPGRRPGMPPLPTTPPPAPMPLPSTRQAESAGRDEEGDGELQEQFSVSELAFLNPRAQPASASKKQAVRPLQPLRGLESSS